MHTGGSPKTVVDRTQKNRKERNQSQECISALCVFEIPPMDVRTI